MGIEHGERDLNIKGMKSRVYYLTGERDTMKSNCICKKLKILFGKFPLGENSIFSNPKRGMDRSR